MPSLSAILPWVKDHPWIVLAAAGLFGLGFQVSLPATRLDAIESRVANLEAQHGALGPLVTGLARVECLKTDPLTTAAAGLPCDTLLHRRPR